MSNPLTENERKLTAALLDLAADTFSNHGCNDFDLSNIFDPAEAREILVGEAVHDGDEEEIERYKDPTTAVKWGNDWCLMRYMADRLREGIY